VADLGYLLGLYAEWHAGLLPYYSFDQFIHKVEKLGGSKRVKLCMKGLRERVADGVDPAKLYEPQIQEYEINQQELKDSEPTDYPEDTMQNPNPKDFQEIMLNDVWEKETEEPFQPSNQNIVAADTSSGGKDTVNQAPDNVAKSSGIIQISEEQRARMEANKLKALQRAAARTTHIKST
ncbi:hypothetical protein HAX54_010440, partial [Datura stramonium]|nr:hypothetical protein [Datura stramonium]